MKKIWMLLTGVHLTVLFGQPHIGFVMPSGARQGSSVELIIGGQRFGGVDDVYVSGGGVTVEYVEAVRKPAFPDPRQRRYLYSWLRKIHKGDPLRPPLPESTEGWRYHPWYERLDALSNGERDILYRFLFVRQNSLQASPAIAKRVLVRMTVAPDAVPGERELRVVARNMVSNPLKFFISKVPELREPYFPMPPAKPAAVHCPVPGVINGQIMPGEKDDFTFSARKGERVVFSAKARYLMPFIGDGVPGHFQMVMEIFDSAGKSVAYADDRAFDPDPELVFTAPADGVYTLQIRDALYRGREDFVYRVEVFPGKAPEHKLIPPELPPLKRYDAAELPESGVIAPGVLISDVLRKPVGNRYRFRAEKGVPLMLEVYGRRQGSPIDPLLKIFDNKGKMLAVCDDVPRLKAGTILHPAADPVLRFIAPESGEYTAVVSDVTGQSGNDFGYFLRISQPLPHFKVYAVPSVVNLNRNGWGKVELVVERFDGFNGEIKLHCQGSKCSIAGVDSIPSGSSRSVITLHSFAAGNSFAPVWLKASIPGFTADVIPGDEMMQAFAYTHIAPAKYLVATQRNNGYGKDKFHWVDTPESISLAEDRSVKVRIIPRNFPKNAEVELVMVDPPSWLKARPGSSHIIPAGKIKPVWNKKAKVKKHELVLTLYAENDGGCQEVNQLFKIVLKYNIRNKSTGKVRVITQEVLLPALRITGKNKCK